MRTNIYFDPKSKKFPYPEITDKHYLIVKKDNGMVFDENYPYIDRSKKMLGKQKRLRFLLKALVFPMTYVRLHLKIKGKENLKKYKDVLKDGAITISNHVNMWDFLAVTAALKRQMHVLVWDKNVKGENGKLVRLIGGIPIPNDNFKAMIAFQNEIENFLMDDHGWLHIYPEGSMWEYYAPIRPFKLGAAYFAVKTNKPILPLAFSYRKPNKFREMIGQPGFYTLTIGEPIFPNQELAAKDAEIDLTIRMHDAICRLANIDPEENIYQPVFDNDQRVDYYTNSYGKKHKNSF